MVQASGDERKGPDLLEVPLCRGWHGAEGVTSREPTHSCRCRKEGPLLWTLVAREAGALLACRAGCSGGYRSRSHRKATAYEDAPLRQGHRPFLFLKLLLGLRAPPVGHHLPRVTSPPQGKCLRSPQGHVKGDFRQDAHSQTLLTCPRMHVLLPFHGCVATCSCQDASSHLSTILTKLSF